VTLKAQSLWRYFGDFAALRDVSLEAGPGECIALLGPNGAGKTTLLKLLAGLAKPQKGVLSLPARRETGYLGHGLGLYEDLSSLENLRFWGGLYGAPESASHEWLQRIRLDHVADAPVRQLSRGMRQRVALGRAFQHRPRLLILDEPFTGLDAESVALLQAVLREAVEAGSCAILSSHQIPEAMSLATRAWKLDQGRLQ
jgi:heme ABC exporter ATP-binding subunit CcmA